MRRGLCVLYAVLPLLIGMVGCVRRYEEPALSEPHALVKFRVLHHEPLPDTTLSEAVRLNGFAITLPEGEVTAPRLRTVRALPVLTRYGFATEYFHTYRTQRVEMQTESYSCGTTQSPRTCTRTVSRTVYTDHHVTDAECSIGLEHIPLAGAVYLIQYDFHGAGACTASCYRQLDAGGGEFQLVACGPSEPPVERSTGGEALAPPSAYRAR